MQLFNYITSVIKPGEGEVLRFAIPVEAADVALNHPVHAMARAMMIEAGFTFRTSPSGIEHVVGHTALWHVEPSRLTIDCSGLHIQLGGAA